MNVRGTIPEARDSSVLIHEDEPVAVLPSPPGPTGAEVDLANRANKDVHSRQPTSVLTNHAFPVPTRCRTSGTSLSVQTCPLGWSPRMTGWHWCPGPFRDPAFPGVRFVRLAGRPAISSVTLAWHAHVFAQVRTELIELPIAGTAEASPGRGTGLACSRLSRR
ncbi:hypothetical protein OG601_38440 [Streptomyces sp. NBC_01239]|uniref:hypothetical protein n=1 Tax=Streptomyces sp. NBC_01239 TaxID=2903792 RepID=UPI0022579764|nr:hypothetical protein [Streptomyces sp. NBC_01239]MCX4816489.1 hypothetical protein [Streptomyces sp. NBC_01239]